MVSSITFTESWNGEWLGRPFQQKKCSKLGWFIVRLTLLSIISLISQERCQTMRQTKDDLMGLGDTAGILLNQRWYFNYRQIIVQAVQARWSMVNQAPSTKRKPRQFLSQPLCKTSFLGHIYDKNETGMYTQLQTQRIRCEVFATSPSQCPGLRSVGRPSFKTLLARRDEWR